MSLVVNNEVKMDWEKSGWFETKSKGTGKKAFIFASKVFKRDDNGEDITVFFADTTAFLFVDEDDFYTAGDISAYYKKEGGIGNFPYSIEDYEPIIDSGFEECKMSVLEKYGLVSYKEEIEARLKDILVYSKEFDESGNEIE